ncbi:unannotated protein [freshwater metagenome]|uniref:Unannotated protein n=1 Tax=freshwater metagenome TaxID=449393 RepID=A0A6J7D7U9_9ZZZZ|nr:DUF1015 family protein [Actinomycetota bacterium]
MADVQPLRALHYDQSVTGPLGNVLSPPYDVIDPEQRGRLAALSPYNVVNIDLPEPDEPGGDPYAAAARILGQWRDSGAVVRDPQPAIWALTQEYAGPDGVTRIRRGFLARVRVEDYGPGRIRPHERTHPGPKEDRLRLTRATQANLSPIFSLYSDPAGAAWAAIASHVTDAPDGEQTDADGTRNRLWRIADPAALDAVASALAPAELLIADGHHRYETARVYADEIGGEGDHRYVLMQLVALDDPGLTVFPTHRLINGLAGDEDRRGRLDAALHEAFEITELASTAELPPRQTDGLLELGYLDGSTGKAYRLTLRDQAIADRALADFPAPYRRLDTAIVEALILTGPLGLSEDDISHFRGLGYSRSDAEAVELVTAGSYDVAFFLPGATVAQIGEIAAAGVNMPPKSTFFTPKVPTGLIFNPLA